MTKAIVQRYWIAACIFAGFAMLMGDTVLADSWQHGHEVSARQVSAVGMDPAREGSTLGAVSEAEGVAASAGDDADAGKGQSPGAIAATTNKSSVFNISRLQARYSGNEYLSFTQSTFFRWPSQMFFLEVFDYVEDSDVQPEYWQMEINVGGPFRREADPYKIGWVGRGVKSDDAEVYSAGVQVNLTNFGLFRETAGRNKLNLFFQVFPVKSNDSLGKEDILFYYQSKLFGPVSMRGTTNWVHYPDAKDYVRAFADFIYPLHKSADVYVRYVYQNRKDISWGAKGSEWFLGFRYNFRL